MHLSSEKLVLKALPPDRPNIYLDVKHLNNYVIERDLRWLVNDVTKNQAIQPKTLV